MSFCSVPSTVLVVDDNEAVRDCLTLLLRLRGFQVASANNGWEALDYLRHHPPPAVIILDVNMPVMDGTRFRQAQLREPDLAGIPVIVYSARYDYRDHPTFESVAAFLCKPVEPEELLRVVCRHGRPAAEDCRRTSCLGPGT